MNKGEVLLDHGVEGDDGGLDIVGRDQVAVPAHVPAGVHQLLHVGKQPDILGGQLLPRRLETGDGGVAQAGDDGEHRVEVLSLLALPGDLDELLDHSHPLGGIRLTHNLSKMENS